MKSSLLKNNFQRNICNLTCSNDLKVNLNEGQAVLYKDIIGLLHCISIILYYCFHYPMLHNYCL